MPSALVALIITSLVVMLVSLSGVVFLWSYLRRLLEGNLHYLVSFAAGVFAVVSVILLWRSFHISGEPVVALGSFLLGFLAIHALHIIFPESHHHHAHECEQCETGHTRSEAIRVLASDALHNIGDGLLLAPAYIADISLGVAATIGVLVHEMVQEISEFFVLRESGYTIPQALLRNFLVSATILIGSIGGFFIASHDAIIAILVGIAGGGFLHVVTLDLLPNSFQKTRTARQRRRFLYAVLAGAAVILAVTFIAHH